MHTILDIVSIKVWKLVKRTLGKQRGHEETEKVERNNDPFSLLVPPINDSLVS